MKMSRSVVINVLQFTDFDTFVSVHLYIYILPLVCILLLSVNIATMR